MAPLDVTCAQSLATLPEVTPLHESDATNLTSASTEDDPRLARAGGLSTPCKQINISSPCRYPNPAEWNLSLIHI